MAVDLLAIWESTKTRLDRYGGQIKQLMKDEACAEGELEAVAERRKTIATDLAVLKQKRADLEVAMQLPEMKRENGDLVSGADKSGVRVPEVATVQAAGAQSSDEHQETFPVGVVPAKDATNTPQHTISVRQQGSIAPQHDDKAPQHGDQAPQRGSSGPQRTGGTLRHDPTSPPEDDGDADFAAMDKRTATKPQSSKRGRSESPDPKDTITAKPRNLQITGKDRQPGSSNTKHFEGIVPDFPTIVRNRNGRWVELRCHVCGENLV
ncbi:hypothetical protein LTR78_001737 [Recurvomyces mirabilis]|uniref:Uncharacterized protein n=1 Tax=Recurvomyces mirabilis TaxID=574656 RepID=A0AAE1C521_9PEZI|nr:hypothetical protein LTR78_001737 [Recurvomyces mirabilis]KAK5150188.1 hypothetical protein LTS14_010317 [Recurvomyces mirabilis]